MVNIISIYSISTSNTPTTQPTTTTHEMTWQHQNDSTTKCDKCTCIWYHLTCLNDKAFQGISPHQFWMVKPFTGHESSPNWMNQHSQGISPHQFERQGVLGHEPSPILWLCNGLHLCISTYNSTTTRQCIYINMTYTPNNSTNYTSTFEKKLNNMYNLFI